MRYTVLIHESETRWEGAAEELRQHYHDQHALFVKELIAHGATLVAGEELQQVTTATTQRRHGDDVIVTDGPFAELLGGFYVVDAPHLDAVLEAIRVLPEPTIEVRPCVDHGSAG